MIDFERLKSGEGILCDAEYFGGELNKLKALAEVLFHINGEYFRKEDIRNGFGQALLDIHENLSKAVDIIDEQRKQTSSRRPSHV